MGPVEDREQFRTENCRIICKSAYWSGRFPSATQISGFPQPGWKFSHRSLEDPPSEKFNKHTQRSPNLNPWEHGGSEQAWISKTWFEESFWHENERPKQTTEGIWRLQKQCQNKKASPQKYRKRRRYCVHETRAITEQERSVGNFFLNESWNLKEKHFFFKWDSKIL